VGRSIVIVLDTHAWVWWLSKPEKLGKKAARAIKKAERIGLPAICVWEVAMKARAGKLKFDRPVSVWIEQGLGQDARLELVPLSPRVAIAAAELEWDHRDPADRLIVSTALIYESPLATTDEHISDSRLVRCIWE
jgi:PIN domain nuclease of toxin-antitoxin system